MTNEKVIKQESKITTETKELQETYEYEGTIGTQKFFMMAHAHSAYLTLHKLAQKGTGTDTDYYKFGIKYSQFMKQLLSSTFYPTTRADLTLLLTTLRPKQEDIVNLPRDDKGNSLLHLAVMRNDWALMTTLIEYGGDIHKPNVLGLTAFQLAKEQWKKNIPGVPTELVFSGQRSPKMACSVKP